MTKEVSNNLSELWQPAETAPHDGNPILVDAGYPWPLVCVWNHVENAWICAELNVGMFNGEWNDTYFEYEKRKTIKAWIPLPAVKE